MLEIIALIILTKKIGDTAIQKGLAPLKWKLATIIAWIVFEFTGIIFAVMMFGKDNLVAVLSIGLMSAFGGFLLVKSILDKQPASIDDDINRIGEK